MDYRYIVLLGIIYHLAGPLPILMLLTGNGFINTFTKYHVIGFLLLNVFVVSGYAGICIAFLSISTYLSAKNYEELVKVYNNIKRMFGCMMNLYKNTDNDEEKKYFDFTESLLNKITYVENKIVHIRTKYDSFKKNRLIQLDMLEKSYIVTNMIHVINYVINVVSSLINVMMSNVLLLLSILYNIKPIKSLVDRVNTYRLSWMKLYDQHVTTHEMPDLKQHDYIKYNTDQEDKNPDINDIMNMVNNMSNIMIPLMENESKMNIQNNTQYPVTIDELNENLEELKELSNLTMKHDNSNVGKIMNIENFNNIIDELRSISNNADNKRISLKRKSNKRTKNKTK